MKRAKVWVATTATGAVLAALLTSPVVAPVAAAPGDPQRIAFTDDQDELQQVMLRIQRVPPSEYEYGYYYEGEGYEYQFELGPPGPEIGVATEPGTRITSSEDGFIGYQPGVDHEGELTGSAIGTGAFVSTRGGDVDDPADDDTDGEVYLTDGEQVTCDNDFVETHPVVNGSGSVAFASNRDGDWDIFLATQRYDAPGGDGVCSGWEVTQFPEIHPSEPADDLWPAWSPNGNILVYSSTADDPLGDLYARQLDYPSLGTPVRITDDAGADTQPAVTELANGDRTESGPVTQQWVAFTTTRFRPDGSIALLNLDDDQGPRGGPPMFAVLNAFPDPSDPGRLPPQSSEAAWEGPTDDTHLAYTSTQDDPAGDVWVTDVDNPVFDSETGDQTEPRAGSVSPVAALPGVAESHAAWNARFDNDTTTLMFTSTPVDGEELTPTPLDPEEEPTNAPHLMQGDIGDVVAPDGSGRRVLVHETGTTGDQTTYRADETTPDYAPDGTVAFTSDLPDSEKDAGRRIMLSDEDGSNVRPLEYTRPTDDIDAEPVWSPDGRRIAFTRYQHIRSGYLDPVVVVVDLDANHEETTQKTVTVEPDDMADENPTWSPDGTHLLVARQVFNNTLAARKPLAQSPGSQTLWVVNPDDGTDSVPLRYNPSCPPTRVCSFEIQGRSPDWSPDGTKVVYQDQDALRTVTFASPSPGPDIWPVGAPTPLTGFAPDGVTATPSRATVAAADDPAWSPDGTEIAFDGTPAGQPQLRGIYAIAPDGTGLRSVTDERGPEIEPVWSPLQGTDVAVTVAISGSPATPGGPVTATYTVTNLGLTRAQDVVLTTSFTAGGTKTASSPPPGCNADGTGCSFGTLAPGDTRQYVVTLTYPSARNGTASGTVTTTSEDVNPSNNTASAAFRIASVDVSVTLTLDEPRGWVGGSRTLQVDVINEGPEPASDVNLTLTYPTDLVTPTSLVPCRNGLLPCTLGTLAPHVPVTFDVPMTMKKGGIAVIAAKVSTSSADSQPANNSDTVSLRVIQPTVRLLPAVARPGRVTMAYGEHMPPGTDVLLHWAPGITINNGPFRVGSDGTMRAPFLLVRHDLLGNREIVAGSTSGAFSDVRGPMLVVERLAVAPDFFGRG